MKTFSRISLFVLSLSISFSTVSAGVAFAEEVDHDFYTMNGYEIKGLQKEQRADYYENLSKHLIEMKSDTAEKYVAPSIADLDVIAKSPPKWDDFTRQIDKLCTVKANAATCKKLANDRVVAFKSNATH